MRQLVCCAVFSGLLAAQKLETLPLDTKKIVRVETAADHLTVIELGDPVTMVAVGNQGAFSVERRQNKVFVKPAEEGARTNLIVWTTAGRFAYELVPAPSVEQMHFAIDQAAKPVAANVVPAPTPAEMLANASPILLVGERETQGRVEISLRDVYRDHNRLHVRYAVINHSGQEYLPSRPAAWRLSGVRTPQSLVPLAEHQLGERLIRSLKSADALRLEVLEASEVAPVAAGGCGVGWLVVSEPQENRDGHSVLRLEFAADVKGTVEAMLVLPPRSGQEVASE